MGGNITLRLERCHLPFHYCAAQITLEYYVFQVHSQASNVNLLTIFVTITPSWQLQCDIVTMPNDIYLNHRSPLICNYLTTALFS